MPLAPLPPATAHVTKPGLAWAALGVLLAAVGWSKAINLLLLLGYALIALFLVNGVLALRMTARVSARRRVGGPVFADEQVAHVLDVENPTARPATVVVSDTGGPQPAEWFTPPLPPGVTETLRTDWTFPARGRYAVGPVRAESGYPFGLIGWTREVGPAGEVLVLPPVGRVDVDQFRRWLARVSGGEGRSRRPARRPTPGTGDVRGVRGYRPGDSPRDVHWRTSARRGQLFVREYDQTDPLNLVLILDPWAQAGGADAAAAGRLEWAVGLAMSLGWAWAMADEPGELTFILPGKPDHVRSGRAGPGFVRSAFAPLADVTGRPDVPAVSLAAARGGAMRTARLVVSTRPDSPLAAGLRRAGGPAAAVDQSAPPRWYLPPGLARA